MHNPRPPIAHDVCVRIISNAPAVDSLGESSVKR